MLTTVMEDYLECIYDIIEIKGYAGTNDIAEKLDISPSTVSRMIKKLDEEGYINYEPYRGMTLTKTGEIIGERISSNHKLLEEFFNILGIEDEEIIEQDIEGIEHYLSDKTIESVIALVSFFKENPERLKEFKQFKDQN
ncbi:transcriptional regulator MntR [Halanaerobium hydrogeniformans]|uniref:Manganese transport regulator n=1 Tax=Halanaerobium hydrogeniformans TaxID=656519 RepID=E4RLL5_HALHG|nr:transcriptional regulator MntR [Halanaerobium hydrogeniformans]ADQ14929.1 iron (metal) dependent repressor, DtxR family [Halanaerobium hydrogeniformans]